MKIFLHLNANIEEYEVTVQNGCELLRQRITTRQGCLCLCLRSPCLRVIARPLTSGYSTNLYFWITPNCSNIINLYFNFPIEPVTPSAGALNTFTLTDATYGMPIDGVLTFTGR